MTETAEADDIVEATARLARLLSSPALAGILAAILVKRGATPDDIVNEVQTGLEGKPEEPSVFERVVQAVTRPEIPSPGWFAQARRNAEARQAFLDEFGALTSEKVADLAGSQATNRRATAHRWQAQSKVFAVTHHTQVVYPGFQFDPEVQAPKPAVADVLTALPAEMTGWALALWWATPADTLEWDRPVDRLDTSPQQVVAAARFDAADWAQAVGR